MEAKLGSRKRKQPSSSASNPLVGIFTRSKSQIYTHHNRSGRARSDAKHTQLFQTPPTKCRSSNQQQPLIRNCSIKDLRAKRVFSPASISGDVSIGIFDTNIDCKAQNLNDVSPNSSSIVEDGTEKNDLGFSVMDSSNPNMELDVNSKLNENGGVSDRTEDCVQMTPPEAVENGETGGKNESISIGSICRNDTARSKLVLSFGGRKVFKAPSSFSYRRLLPYLMDIAKDDSRVSKIEIGDVGIPCKVQNPTRMNPNLSLIGDYNVDDIGAHFDDRKPAENVGVFKYTCKFQNLNGVNHNFTQTEGKVKQRNYEDGNNNRIDDLMEGCDQMTPPDADIFSKAEIDDSIANKEDVSHNEHHMLGKPSDGSVIRNDDGIVESFCGRRNDSISKCKLVLNPCSRMKLFRTQSSVSYRRFLPFKMDSAEDDSCASKNIQCPKLEKDSKQKSQPIMLASSHQDIPVDKSETDGNSGQCYMGDEEPIFPTPVLNSSDISSDETNPSLPISSLISTNGSSKKEPILASSENITEPHMPLDSQVEWASQLEHVISDNPRKLEREHPHDLLSYGHETNNSAVSLCFTGNCENLPLECASECSELYSVHTKKDCIAQRTSCNKDEGNPVTVGMYQNSSQIEAFDPSRIIVDGPRKGILKRNPRGCRGLCNCLNCASFRLHAERAFEFSRNQMKDAEEVSFELIKELTYLRNILETSAVDANCLAVVHGNKVKEACRKAMKTEELAKRRLEQMAEDLNSHCRSTCLQRPRVTFANNVEEKVIPKARLANK